MHRIGRTARAQSKGEAFTLIVPDEMYAFGRIEKLIEMSVEKLPLPEGFGEQPTYDPNLRTRGGHGGNAKGGRGGNQRRGESHQGSGHTNRRGGNGAQRGNRGASNRPPSPATQPTIRPKEEKHPKARSRMVTNAAMVATAISTDIKSQTGKEVSRRRNSQRLNIDF